MVLPGPDILTTLTSIDDVLAPNEHSAVLSLLEEYDDLVPTGPHDFGLMKDTQYQLNLEYTRSFRAQNY